jgi:hypothetical protein
VPPDLPASNIKIVNEVSREKSVWLVETEIPFICQTFTFMLFISKYVDAEKRSD